MNQQKVFSQSEIEQNGAAITGHSLSEGMTLEQVFGPVENWLMQLGPYHLLYMPIHDRWLYWDWVHESWQDTGHKAFEVTFYLDGDQVKTRPAGAQPATGQDFAQQTFAQQTFAQQAAPLPEVAVEPTVMPDIIESTAISSVPPETPAAVEQAMHEMPFWAPKAAQAEEPHQLLPEPVFEPEAVPATPALEELLPVQPVTDVQKPISEASFAGAAGNEVFEPAEVIEESALAIPEPVANGPEAVELEVTEPETPAAAESQPLVEPEMRAQLAPVDEPAPFPEMPLPETPESQEESPATPPTPLPAAAPKVTTAPLGPSEEKPTSAPQPVAKPPVTPAPHRMADEYAATMLYKRPVIWELRVIEGPQASIVYRLKPLTTIGRSSDNVISLDDPMASRHHTRLEWAGDNYIAIDLNSSNGTFVNDQRISTPVMLEEGSTLLVGQTRFVVQKREG